MTSPDGNQFTALWIGGPRSASKKLGVFEYPGVIGSVFQDLGLTSDFWSLTFHFEGADHDIEADRFVKATRETGLWAMTHPVYGFLGLQLMRFTEKIEPTRSGNVRDFESEWVESIDPTTLKTAAELSGELGINIDALSASSFDDFNDDLSILTALDEYSISSALNKVSSAIDSTLGPLYKTTAAVQNEMLAIQRGIQDTMSAAILNPLALAGQIQALVETPLRAINDIKSRLDYYGDLADALFGIQPSSTGTGIDGPTVQGKNTAAVQQLALNSTLSANAQIANTNPEDGGLLSQKEAIKMANIINDQYVAIKTNMEESQEVFANSNLVDQLFSQRQSHSDAMLATASAVRFLYQSSYDLKKERRFAIDRPRSPLEIAVVEYGGFGDNDENLKFFIETNNLSGTQIFLLPAKFEVSIYA
jgi:hypothetical protein